MAVPNMAQVPAKLYEILEPLTPHERIRAVRATLVLFGDDTSAVVSDASAPVDTVGVAATPGIAMDPGTYFDQKSPQNKGETLAVAARYLEVHEGPDKHSKADLKRVITAARRNFDSNNFARDIANARRQAGFFNTNTGRDASQLSYFGQQYVDAMPDKDTIAKLKRPKVGGAKKRTAKPKAADGK